MDKKTKALLKILPHRISERLNCAENIKSIEEIRLKRGMPLLIYLRREELLLNDEKGDILTVTNADIEEVILNATGNSLYAYLDDIKKGFITVEGGHRIGICGTAVTEKNEIINIKDINAINIRVAHEIKGVADNIIDYIYHNHQVKNTIIISPPQAGKTTLIRDVALNLSKIKMMKIVVIDERCEIGAVFRGEEQNELGLRVFVLSGYNKSQGFEHALRGLSPTVIICDELCGEKDMRYIENALNRGVKVVATIHGYSEDDPDEKLKKLFDCVIVFKNGEFKIMEDKK